jgi:hypothetical protein
LVIAEYHDAWPPTSKAKPWNSSSPSREQSGELQRVKKTVDADEELSAITYMATRNEKAPALLFENVSGDNSSSSVLANMLGRSALRSRSASIQICPSQR